MLGVINITPNSFSDGGINLDPNNLVRTLKYFSTFSELVWDLGFESTASMNSIVKEDEELNRFKFFLETCSSNKIKIPEIVSIDTYKISTIQKITTELKKINPKVKIIFNDVSGSLDSELVAFLKNNPDVCYIYCFTKNVTRKNVHDHMKNISHVDNIVRDTVESFNYAQMFFETNKLENILLLDPCFGFSKTMEDNWKLIDRYNEVMKHFKHNQMVIGLSKKSFIHKKIIESDNPKEDSEFVHFQLIREFHKLKSTGLIFRIHDPMLCTRALKIN